MPIYNNQENSFYICLLSNNSMNSHGGNTLSSFTNVLRRHLKIAQKWYVGLTEIGFGEYTEEKSRLVKKINPFRESSGDSDNNEDDMKNAKVLRLRRSVKIRKFARNVSLEKKNIYFI